MSIMDIESSMSSLSATLSSIQLLSYEVSEELTANIPQYYKLHAVFVLTEALMSHVEDICDNLVELRALDKQN